MDLQSTSLQNGESNSGQLISEDDKERILYMRELIEKEDPTAKVDSCIILDLYLLCLVTFMQIADDVTLRRFLYAQESKVHKACELYLKYRKWRKKFVPLGYISETIISNELKKNLVCLQGFDKKGRPIAVIPMARHKPCHKTLEDLKRFFVYSFDKMSSRALGGQEKFTIIADLSGWTYKHVDIRGYLAILEILQEYYPERLGQLYIIHYPYIFWAAWNIVYPFIDKRTKQKVMIVEKEGITSTLLNDIDKSQLPEIYGGELPLVPVQNAVVPNWPPN